MKHAIRILALACAAAAIATPTLAQAPAAAGAPPSVLGDMVKDWSALKETMAKLASAVPEDKYSFKPTPAQQSFAERVVHVATVNNRFLDAVGGKATAPAVDAKAAAMSKDAAIKAMNDSFDYGLALLKEQTDQTFGQPAANPPGFLGPSTRARLFTFLLGHTWDIYGQLVVYARLNDVTPPASQRP